MRLYPKVVVERQSFVGVKIITQPNQSMTLQEVIRRFIRKESLPLAHDAVYHEGLGDLEKMQHEDLTEREYRIAELKSVVKSATAKAKADDDAKAKAAADLEFSSRVSKAVGEALAQAPTPKGS